MAVVARDFFGEKNARVEYSSDLGRFLALKAHLDVRETHVYDVLAADSFCEANVTERCQGVSSYFIAQVAIPIYIPIEHHLNDCKQAKLSYHTKKLEDDIEIGHDTHTVS